ncbi:hypothetical protein D3C73_1393590 [compost metagenome]
MFLDAGIVTAGSGQGVIGAAGIDYIRSQRQAFHGSRACAEQTEVGDAQRSGRKAAADDLIHQVASKEELHLFFGQTRVFDG